MRGRSMNRKHRYFINYLHMALAALLFLTIYLRKMGIDGSNGGINFANIAGGSFLILLLIEACFRMFGYRAKWEGSPIMYKLFVILLSVGFLLVKLCS